MSKINLSPAFWQGMLLYKQQKWAAAALKFAKVLANQPDHATANFKLGMCHLKQKQWIRASRFINQAIELSPQKQGWRVQQERANKERIKSELAKLKESKLSAAQKEDQIREWIGEDYKNPQLHNELAHTLRQQGKWWQEVEALSFATSLEGRHPTWFYRLGEALEAMNRFQQAAKAYGQAIELKKGKAEAQWYYRQGYCLEREGHDGPANPSVAQRAYEEAIAKDTQLKAKRFGIGVFHQARGLWPQAQQAYAQQQMQAPWDEELYYRLGMTHDRCYEWEKAEQTYRLALALDINRTEWHYRLGFVLERQHKYQDAAIAYEYAAKNRATHTPYWFYRWGYVLEKAGHYEQACQAYLQTQTQQTLDPIDLDPIDLDPILVQYKAQLNNQETIAATLEKVLEQDTTNPETWFKLGNAYERLKNWTKAAAAYEHAVKRSSNYKPNWYFRLGYALVRASRLQDACVYFKNCEKLQLPHGVKALAYAKTPAQLRISTYAEFLQTKSIDNKAILYESWVGERFSCNPYAMFKYISAKYPGKYTHIIVANNKKAQIDDEKYRSDIVYVSRDSDLYLHYLATAKYLINNTSFPNFFIRRDEQKYLNTWHGTPQKHLGIHEVDGLFNRGNPARNFVQATHIISPNEHTTNSLLDGYDARYAITAKVAETGYPRCDLMLNMTIDEKHDLKEQLSLNNGKRTVLYAPTWRGDRLNPKAGGREATVIKLLTTFNWNVLFRGHFLAEEALSHVRHAVVFVDSSIDTNELLAISDLLITDYSSIYLDFIATSRPIIHYVYDYDEYCATRGVYFGAEEMPGDVCKTDEDFNQSLIDWNVKLSEDKQFQMSERYQNAAKRFAVNEDGFASKRVADFFFDDQGSFTDFSEQATSTTLIFGGHLKPNGITNSLISIIDAGKKAGNNICLVIDRQAVSNKLESAKQFSKIKSNITVLGWTPSLVATIEERFILNQVKIQRSCTPSYEKEYRRLMKSEYQRNFGNAYWSSVIDFNGYSSFWTDVLSEAKAVKKTIFCHSDIVEEWKIRFPDLIRIIGSYKKFNQIVSVSKGLKHVNEFNLKKIDSSIDESINKFIYLENLIDENRLLEQASGELVKLVDEIKLNKRKKFCSVGRLSTEKGHMRLIEAFKDALGNGLEASLYIVGSGPDYMVMKDYIKRCNLNDYVILLGYIDNPFPILREMDVFVMPSYYEGQGIAILEALAVGLPVISTDSIGPRSILENGYGCIVENSTKGIRDALVKHLCDDVKYKEFDFIEYNNAAKACCLNILF
jgi:CDP-glycerol glycerophosphotransferase